ncbi:MAG: glycosyltransferase family 4 protein [Saprospiraceae bacterium]|nr:glycosyltransferase family 4 protein [Saprospiraceae bacterium]
MKVILASNSAWNLFNFRRPLMRSLKARGDQLIILCPEDKYLEKLFDEFQFSFIPVKHLKPRKFSPWSDFLLLREIWNIYRKEKPDLVFHFTIKWNIYGGMAARFMQLNYVSHLTGLGSLFINPSLLSKGIGIFYRISLITSIWNVFHNRHDLDWMQKNGFVDETRSSVFPGSGVDVHYFCPNGKIEKPVENILFAGRILPEKGIFEFCEAAEWLKRIYPQISFELTGDDKDISKNRKLHRRFLDYVQRGIVSYIGNSDDMVQVYNRADLFVLPSYREGRPKAILEAMAMELPVITTNVVGCNDISDHIDLVVPKSSMALYQKILEYIQKPLREMRELGQNNRKTVVMQYSSAMIEGLYSKLLNQLYQQIYAGKN